MASQPSSLKGSFGTLPKGYVCNVHSPRVPKTQRAHSHQATPIPDYYKESYIDHTQDNPCSLVESAAYAFLPAWQTIAIDT